jgi:phosphatidylserine/phosphatidylglycerophosphate/cardiolipin synthase-like enzyme
MTKKRSSSRSDKAMTLQLTLVGLAILLILIVLYGFQGALEKIGVLTGVDVAPTEGSVNATPPGEPSPDAVDGGQAGDYFQVYFTEPENFTGDEVEGGIELHLIDLINSAHLSIEGATFEFNLDDVADALIAASERGVDVRLVYDDEHTEDDPQMERLIAAGIEATPDERSAFMHNKFFVIDGQTVWLGSWNVTTNDTFRNNNNVIVIRSTQLAENYTDEFEEMFRGEFGPTSPSETPNQAFTLNGIQIESYFASEDAVMPRLIEFVTGATESVHFMAFSYTDNALADAMIGRLDAGLDVSGVFEQRGANTEYSSCPPLLDAGADVRLDGNGYTFHHKIIIIDGKSVAIGSFNFSANAAESNDENMIIVHDPRVAALYEQEFNKQFGMGEMPVGGECLDD